MKLDDGACLLVGTSVGVCVNTETSLRTVLNEKVVPMLFLNKVDLITDLK